MSKNFNLTKGAVQQLFSGNTDEQEPILQILEIKKMQPKNTKGKDRYRIIISDGQNYMQSMVGSTLGDIDVARDLQPNCIVRILDSVTNNIHNRKFLIVLRLEVINSNVKEMIGKPSNIEKNTQVKDEDNVKEEEKVENIKEEKTETKKSISNNKYVSRGGKQDKSSNSNQTTVLTEDDLMPIGHLTPFTNTVWTIKARITQKSAIKTWDKNTSKGKLLSIDLCDSDNNEIRAVLFNEAVDKYESILKPGKVYLISKGRLKNSNAQYSTIKNSYEISLDQHSIIQLCEDDDSNIPKLKYNLVRIQDLDSVNDNSTIDVLGYVEKIEETKSIKTKFGKDTNKTSIYICDNGKDSQKYSVEVSFWGDIDISNIEVGKTILCKNAKKTNFKSISLSMSHSSPYFINPDIKESQDLLNWYKKYGNDSNIKNLSVSTQKSSTTDNKIPKKNIEDIKNENIGESKQEAINVVATVTFIKKEGNLYYEACGNTRDGKTCNKKVVSDGGGYSCTLCGHQTECVKRYIMNFIISDHTGHVWCTGFNESSILLNNTDPNDLIDKKNNNPSEFDQLIDSCNFKTYSFILKIDKSLINDGASKVNISIVKAYPIDYVKSSKKLIDQIEKL